MEVVENQATRSDVVQFEKLSKCDFEIARRPRYPSGRRRCVGCDIPCGMENPAECPIFVKLSAVIARQRAGTVTIKITHLSKCEYEREQRDEEGRRECKFHGFPCDTKKVECCNVYQRVSRGQTPEREQKKFGNSPGW